MADQENTVLRDALSAAFDKVEGTDAGEGSAPERVEPEAREEAQAGEAADRARDEHGRFTKADQAAGNDAGAADGKDKSRPTLTLKGKPNAQEKQERKDQAAPQAGVVEQAAKVSNAQHQSGDAGNAPTAQSGGARDAGAGNQPILPPQHWNGRDKVEWERLPYHVKETLSQEYQTVAELRNLNSVLDPLKQRFTQEFGGTDRALQSILSYWQFARTQPLDFLRDFIQQSRIDPQSLFGGAPEAHQAQPESSADPVVASLQQELAAIRGQLQQVQQQPLIAQQNQIQAEVTSFGSAVDKDGRLAHPYFNDVKPVMAALMQSGQARDLQEAYDMACYANPTVRTAMITARDQGQAEERRRAAEQARAASASVTGAPGHRGQGKPQNETAGQTLARVYEQLSSGARA